MARLFVVVPLVDRCSTTGYCFSGKFLETLVRFCCLWLKLVGCGTLRTTSRLGGCHLSPPLYKDTPDVPRSFFGDGPSRIIETQQTALPCWCVVLPVLSHEFLVVGCDCQPDIYTRLRCRVAAPTPTPISRSSYGSGSVAVHRCAFKVLLTISLPPAIALRGRGSARGERPPLARISWTWKAGSAGRLTKTPWQPVCPPRYVMVLCGAIEQSKQMTAKSDAYSSAH